MTFQRHSDKTRDPQGLHSVIDDDRAWASIFGVVIIAGLALAALFFFMNSGDNTPTRHTAVHEPAPTSPSAPPPTQRK
jgi:hypothetical protein